MTKRQEPIERYMRESFEAATRMVKCPECPRKFFPKADGTLPRHPHPTNHESERA
jgi:uncharacterized OB-fold protein